MRPLAEAALIVVRAITGIALVVFIFVPVDTLDRVVIFLGCVIVLIGCFIASDKLEEIGRAPLTMWPPKNRK